LHRWFLRALAVWLVVIGVLEVIAPGAMESTGRSNPMGIGPAWVGTVVDASIVLLPIGTIVGVIALIAKARHADALERAQLRWFFAGSATLLIMFVLFAFGEEQQGNLFSALLALFFLIGFWSLPAAISIAVLRYRLYDIDRVLSRTVSYLLVAGILAAIYVVLVLALQTVLPVGSSQVAVAGSTLAAAAMFAPVHRVVRQRIERRFNRARYEARVVTADFARRLQREFDLDIIGQDISEVVARTVAPSRVQVWLRP
jgi:hypothetical protein